MSPEERSKLKEMMHSYKSGKDVPEQKTKIVSPEKLKLKEAMKSFNDEKNGVDIPIVSEKPKHISKPKVSEEIITGPDGKVLPEGMTGKKFSSYK